LYEELRVRAGVLAAVDISGLPLLEQWCGFDKEQHHWLCRELMVWEVP
jgi:hypothetical protein